MAASSAFNQRIKYALADPQLQSALDGNADRRQNAFTASFASLPGGRQALRERAHNIRSHVIANLDRYLDQFTGHVSENGITVHFAKDGKEAVEIIKQIIRVSGSRLVVKSKSMVSEEIHLNKSLESEEIQVVETDLGEYIIQLRGEPPAHIITPAVHLTRAQVARTFEEKIGLPFTTDIPVLTMAARRVLRQKFLDAGVGISGVNFGVAETGTLVLVTNEGNGRMCTTLPDVHIALMGIERLVPTLNDLAVMLNLLPRSATGQKLSVYTSLIHGPRRPGELDGPSQRHLILLDNGRQALRHSPLSEILYCIRCGACLNACPVFREIGGHAYVGVNGQPTTYPGPIGSVVSSGLMGVENFGNLARASSLCGACKDACPIDIDLPGLLLEIRKEGAEISDGTKAAATAPVESLVPGGMQLGLQAFSIAARSAGLFRTAQRLGGFFTHLVPSRNGWMHLPDFTGWGYGRDFPRLASQPFSASGLAKELAPQATAGINDQALIKKSIPGLAISASPIVTANSTVPPIVDLIERFENEISELGGTAIHCNTKELTARVLEIIRANDAKIIQAWEDDLLPSGLVKELEKQGVAVTQNADPEIKIGLTGALAGIAESGALVLPCGPGRPPTASLLPETHIAVLRSQDLHERLHQALALPEITRTSSTVIITGPSRTADIEMTLTIGVHGPRHLVVFVIDQD
jgi:L-lactate dehydrogenase complex protein LldF